LVKQKSQFTPRPNVTYRYLFSRRAIDSNEGLENRPQWHMADATAIISGWSAVAADTQRMDIDSLDRLQCRQCQNGNNDACADLLKRHEKRIAKLVWRFSRDRGTHAELVQETIVQAYLSLPRYKPTGVPFEHWLARIATRVGYQFWKSQSRSRRMSPLTEAIDVPVIQENATDPSTAGRMLHELLALLPPADRLVLTLMYFEECSVKEIGQRAGWNTAMVKMRAYRARNRLKSIIEQKKMTDVLKEFVR
jgi:RNA polymerase sigma-70 factor (ECF subfamily)